jgi:nitroimidazol reductase NimA-like FMN-containing flavoprotein (pyridoxamine 5'-phosphate oxidase superfamily)
MIIDSKVLDFVKSQDLCVLSTVSALHGSESAVMAFTIDSKFRFYFSSEPSTRKLANISSNPLVSIVIGGLKNDPSVQIDGQAQVLTGHEVTDAKNFMLSVHPELKDYLSETCQYFVVDPSWCRYSDYSQNPPQIIES